MITVENLNFSYTAQPFIKNVDFSVENGEIFGFLGPSGAGKSTLQKILIGIIKNYSGKVVVNGSEIKDINNRFYEKIGIDFEFPSLYDKLSARKNLEFFSSLYSGSKRDIDELLKSVGLYNDADKKVGDFSKGMKSRLNFIKALVHDPELLFLDEPTSGLDPTNSRLMKDLILNEHRHGKTIILTTHNMEDAAELCDRVAFIVDGEIKAMDTPRNLIMRKSAAEIVYTYYENGEEKTKSCKLEKTSQDSLLKKLIEENRILTIHSKEQTLGDVFIDVTGRKLS
jgi:fluoroquinolone transport system ATP-binding protein